MPSIFKSASRKDKPSSPAKSFSVPSRDRASAALAHGTDAPGSPRIVSYTEFGGLQHAQPPRTPAPSTTPLAPFDFPASPYADSATPPILPPKYSFAPTRLPTITAANSIDSFAYSQYEVTKPRSYGFLGGIGAKVTLALDEVGSVVKVVGKELEHRALTTPLLFSNQALELSPLRVRTLIQSYLDCLRSSSTSQRDAWTRDLQFAREHELAWMLRWALSRIARLKEGTREVSHGVLEWEAYEEWRGRERAANYPHDGFPYLSAIVPAKVYHIIVTPLLSLLSRFAAHSHLSGLTPHALSSLFAPFFFDIPTSSPCLVAHASYVRAASATEHLLLSYIRWTGRGQGLGVTDLPGRLREWVTGYPAMVASDADLARATPRCGARSVRCERASRIVRAYSKDLITAAELWTNDVDSWFAWERVLLRARRGEASRPKFSAGWKKRMAVKDRLPLPANSPASGSEFSYGQARPPRTADRREEKRFGGGTDDGQGVLWGSLAGKEWSIFEEAGFDAPDLSLAPEKKEDMSERLQFDLNESAKMSVTDRRKTMEWTDFAAPTGGFTRTDPMLDVSLSFATPLSSSINEWPKEREDLHRRLHKSQKEATPFNYDTTPRVGADVVDPHARADQHGRVYIEESFVDWWADWGVGGGWIDKDELTFREASWALIEYKAMPSRPQDNTHDPLGDPRTSDLYFLFEEKVPVEYQLAIANPQEKRTFATLFNVRKKRNNANSPTKGGRGQFGWEDHEFDRMLHRNNTTRITASKSEPPRASVWETSRDPHSPAGSSGPSQPAPRAAARPERSVSNGSGHLVEGKPNFFSKNKDRVVRRVKTEEGQRERAKIQRGQEVDFELASASGLSSSSPDTSPRDGERKGDDRWMDILIANGARRMERQDAGPAQPRRRPAASPVPPQQAGLPVTPHSPARHPSPTPPRQITSAAHPAPRTQCSEPFPLNMGLTHSPEMSGSDAEVEAVTPLMGAETQSWGSERRKPMPSIEAGVMEELGEGKRASSDRENDRGPVPPLRDRADTAELLAPSPTWQRDTITGIVDGYRDSVLTTGTAHTAGTTGTTGMTDGTEGGSSEVDDSEISFAQEQEAEYRSRFKSEEHGRMEGSPFKLLQQDDVARPAHGGQGLGLQHDNRGDVHDDEGQNHHVADDVDDDEARDEVLCPPDMSAPVFDLTPGREPSPARYRHGEPLEIVGEDPEEEEYYK